MDQSSCKKSITCSQNVEILRKNDTNLDGLKFRNFRENRKKQMVHTVQTLLFMMILILSQNNSKSRRWR